MKRPRTAPRLWQLVSLIVVLLLAQLGQITPAESTHVEGHDYDGTESSKIKAGIEDFLKLKAGREDDTNLAFGDLDQTGGTDPSSFEFDGLGINDGGGDDDDLEGTYAPSSNFKYDIFTYDADSLSDSVRSFEASLVAAADADGESCSFALTIDEFGSVVKASVRKVTMKETFSLSGTADCGEGAKDVSVEVSRKFKGTDD